MKTDRLWLALGTLSLIVGCGVEAPQEPGGGAHESIAPRVKAHTVAETATVTGTQSSTSSGTGTHATTATVTNTSTGVTSATDYYTVTGTMTGTAVMTVYYYSWVGTSTNTTTNTRTTTAVGPTQSTAVFTKTLTNTVTNSRNGTETKTATARATGFVTFTGTTTVTVTNTVTRTSGSRVGTGTRVVTAAGTAANTGSAVWTWHPTYTATQTGTASNTTVVTNTGTTIRTATLTVTATDTQTGACLQLWRQTTCGDWCLRETQDDRKNCRVFLDCYLSHNCGPSTCGGVDDVCGVNRVLPKLGSIGKEIADQVYQCMACPGSPPATSCAGLPDTTPCSDNNACTTNDRCLGGACALITPVTCSASDECHTAGTCNPVTGCSNPAKPAGTICRPAAGDCDSPEVCAGTEAGCPPDSFLPASTTCRPSAGACDVAESCSGNGPACPADALLPPATVCREAAGPCDAAETCSGSSPACPNDALQPAATVCRPAADTCDVAESCDGSSVACPADVKQPDDTSCDDGSACTSPDKCQGGTCVGQNPRTCAASDQCHLAGTCNAATGDCPNDPVPDGTDCYYSTGCVDGGLCHQGSCMGGTCATCASVNLIALKTYSPASSTDAEHEFAAPSLFTVPALLHVIDGLSGNGTTTVSVQTAGACPTCFTTCTYRGASSEEHPSTPVERAYAGFYVFESCEGGLVASQKLLATKVRLHAEQGDSQAGPTRVQLSVSCAEDQSVVVEPIAQASVVNMSQAKPTRSQPPLQPPASTGAGPAPKTNPEVNGVFTPIANPNIVFVGR